MGLSKTDKAAFFVILLLFLISFSIYSKVPERLPVHWNAAGEADGYGSRFMGLFLMPIIILAVYLLFIFIPKMAVFKKNIEDFLKYFESMKLVILLFFVGLYSATIIQIYRPFNMSYFVAPAVAVLLYYTGYLMKFAKRNFFIGIRTPWTLSSDMVWEKTHKIGSVLFRIVAVFVLTAFFFPEYFLWIFLIPLSGMVVFLFVYSYLEFRKEKM